eukprot:5671935-Pyramimonas_sp.AAC.1
MMKKGKSGTVVWQSFNLAGSEESMEAWRGSPALRRRFPSWSHCSHTGANPVRRGRIYLRHGPIQGGKREYIPTVRVRLAVGESGRERWEKAGNWTRR